MGKVDVGGGKPLGPPLKVPVAAPPPKRIAPPPKVPTPGPAPKHVAPTGYSRSRPSPKTPDRGPRPKAPGPRPLRSPGGDVQSGGYNFQAANRFKQTPAYRNAILSVFAHQPVQQKLAIVQGLTRNNTWNTPEGHAIKDYSISHLSQSEMRILEPHIPTGAGESSVFSPIEAGLTEAGRFAAGLIQKIPTPGFNTPGEHIAERQAGLGPGQLAKNVLKDAVSLPAEAAPSLILPIREGIQHGPLAGLGMVASGVAQAVSHPQEHPLNAFLTVTGLAHGVTRLADAGVRAAAGKPANIARPGIEVTGNLTRERPAYSKYPLIRQSQKAHERVTFRRNEQGQLVPANETQRNQYINRGVSQQVGVNERVRRSLLDMQVEAHAKSVRPKVTQRVAHGARTARKTNPEPALIPGAGVLARVADRTFRRPDTFHADLAKHLQQVAATRADLLDEPKFLELHDKYVAELHRAQDIKRKDVPALYNAADRYARDLKDTHGLQEQAFRLGHYRDMNHEALLRRELQPIVLTHMDGARLDPKLGMVQDTARGARKLSTQEMLDFAKKETGGRLPAYTSHAPSLGDSAFFVSGQKRPLPVQHRNTGFAFTHGLTDPSHEALLERRAYLQNIVSSHESVNRLLDLLAVRKPDGGTWNGWQAAHRDAPPGYKVIALARPWHPREALGKALDKIDMTRMDEEALKHSLNWQDRTQQTNEPGQYALIHEQALAQLRKHENQISPNEFWRTVRGATTQFRKVALSTSPKHFLGVAQENLIRDITNGIGIQSSRAARQAFRRAAEIDPHLAQVRRIELTGGQAAGMTKALATRQVSRHFAGTALEGPLHAMEKFFRAPGARQMRTAWNAYTHFTLSSMKHYLEETHQMAGVGKVLLRDFGRLGRLQGEALDKAARGILDAKTARQLRAENDRFFGRWTDQTPGVQTALTFSPFGMWWANSARFLGRLPIDHPVKTSVLAAANTGTEPQRRQLGLDLFAPNALPAYEQGGIPSGGNIIAQNYYSPAGIANDPIATGQSLIMPWLEPLLAAMTPHGNDWLGKGISSPSNPRGDRDAKLADRGRVLLDTLLTSFLPFYMKAAQVAEGGASQYDTSSLLFGLQPKPGQTPSTSQGLKKALQPFRSYKAHPGSGAGPLGPGLPSVPNLPQLPSLPNLPTLPNAPNVP